jgi:hypothetical protein
VNVARWGIVVGIGGATAACGLWMRSLGLFSAAAAMIALRAGAVPFGSPPSLGALGLDLPPLPIVLAMPLGLVPQLRSDPLAPVIVSSLAAGLAAWWLFGSLRAIGLGVAASGVLVAGVALHPAWLYAAASGSASILASALLVVALRHHRSWQRTGDALFAIVSAFAVALGGLARYDILVVGAAVAAFILVAPRARPAEPRDERPAFAIAYASAIGGALGLWIVVNWSISGDPLAFIGRSLAAVAAPPSAQPPLDALVVAIPALGLAGIAAAMRRAPATALATGMVAGVAGLTAIVSGSPLSLDAVVPLVPLSALLVGEMVAGRAQIAVALAAPALVATGVAAFLLSADWGEAHRAIVDIARGRSAEMWSGERDAAEAVRSRGGRILLDERVEAVVALLAGPERTVSADTLADGSRAPRVDLVLARTPTGRGAFDRVDALWPTLYEGGVSWASRVGSWPTSGEAAEYRLYAVSPVGQE